MVPATTPAEDAISERTLKSDFSDGSKLPSLFAIVRVSETKIILVDDVLGLHLPIFQWNVSEVACCAHRSPIVKTQELKDIIIGEMLSSAEAAARERMSRRNSVPARPKSMAASREDSSRPYTRSNSSGAAGKSKIPVVTERNKDAGVYTNG